MEIKITDRTSKHPSTQAPKRLLLAPQRLQAFIPTTAIAVVGVANRIFLVVVLVVFLRRIERARRNDLGVHGLDLATGEQSSPAGFGDFAFFVGLPVDSTAVLGANITELAVFRLWIDVEPEMIDQLGKAHF